MNKTENAAKILFLMTKQAYCGECDWGDWEAQHKETKNYYINQVLFNKVFQEGYNKGFSGGIKKADDVFSEIIYSLGKCFGRLD